MASETEARIDATTRGSRWPRGLPPLRRPSGTTLVTAAVSLAIAVVCSGVSLGPAGSWGDLDGSWVLGLVWWFEHHASGSPVSFTYGPLGWLTNTVAYSRPTAALSVLFLLSAMATLAGLVMAALRARFGWLVAVVAGVAMGRLTVPEAEVSALQRFSAVCCCCVATVQPGGCLRRSAPGPAS